MSKYYNKDKLKSQLEPEQIFDLLEMFGGNPVYQDDYILSETICHHLPGEGKQKLYYYYNSQMFMCYSNCGSFDVFELCIKVREIQYGQKWELYDAMEFIASFFGFEGETSPRNKDELIDWKLLERYDYTNLSKNISPIILKEYNPTILSHFFYPRIQSWEEEGITAEVYRKNLIGYYPSNEQITIPHFDINNRLVGIRGRYLSEEDAKRYGKYRPLAVNGELFTHPLSMNLYHLNASKDNIKKARAAIVLESEKSTLQVESYLPESDISVACCGSSVSRYQIDLLLNLGVNEIILGFDRDFEKIGDDRFKKLVKKMAILKNKYKSEVKISAIFDKNMITPIKSSPTDCGKDIFLKLLNERITDF